jgi:hypothetical protein
MNAGARRRLLVKRPHEMQELRNLATMTGMAIAESARMKEYALAP